jgi:germination protein M
MDTKKIAILGALVLLSLILAVVFFRSGGEERIRHYSDEPLQEQETLSREPLQTRSITLFFLSEDDNLLHPEKREILDDSSVAHLAVLTIRELLKGSQMGLLSALPLETELRELFITKGGIAYVDLSAEIREGHQSGSSAEIATVFSVVNSLTYNFRDIKKVFILIDGSEKETLAGHVDLSQPLVPRYDLVAN